VCFGSLHNGIDLFAPTPLNRASRGNKIFNNNISFSYCGGIFVASDNSTEVYNNRIINISGVGCGGTVISGIQVTGNATIGHSGRYYNNTIANISNFDFFKTCIFAAPFNTTFENNTMTNCGQYDVLIQNKEPGTIGTASFKNNIYPSGSSYFWSGRGNTRLNYTVNETNDQMLINYSNNGTTKLDYIGLKEITILNNTLEIRSFPSSLNQIFLQNQSTPFASNVDSINITLPPNNRTFIFTYTEADDPQLTALATTITDYSISYTEETLLSIDCTGTGTHTVTNLNDIKGTGDAYLVYHNNVQIVGWKLAVS